MMRFLITLILCTCAVSAYRDVYEGTECTLRNGNKGSCANLKNCPDAQNDLKRRTRPVVCSFSGFEPIVCCAQPAAVAPELPATSAPATTKPDPTPAPAGGNIAKQKCNEYAEYVYTLEKSFLIGEPPVKTDECGIAGAVPTIIDGEPAAVKEFPHMAAIGYDTKYGLAWLCGGSLISERYVLTAAHCLEEKNDNGVSKALYVRMGDVNLVNKTDGATQEFRVQRRIQHPEYKAPVKYHDIGLIELDHDAKFNPFVRPACLQTERTLPREDVTITGWGRTDYLQVLLKEGGAYEPTLQKAVIKTVGNARCSQRFPKRSVLRSGVVDNWMLCAGTQNGTKDACQGDSGGPLQYTMDTPYCMYSISGVTAFGKRCGEVGQPAIYTRVSHYVPWIESIVWSK